MYARQFCTNNPSHKIYCCMSERSTRHHTLLHTDTILHTKSFFARACHPRKIYCYMSAHPTRHYALLHNPTVLHTKNFFVPACYTRQKVSSTSKYVSNTYSSQNIPPFSSLGLGLQLQFNRPLAHNMYKSLHATT